MHFSDARLQNNVNAMWKVTLEKRKAISLEMYAESSLRKNQCFRCYQEWQDVTEGTVGFYTTFIDENWPQCDTCNAWLCLTCAGIYDLSESFYCPPHISGCCVKQD